MIPSTLASIFAAIGIASVPPVPPRAAPPCLVRNVRLADVPGGRDVVLLLRDGRIERVAEPGVEVPPDAIEIDGKGRLAVPAFIDAFSQAGCTVREPVTDQDAPADPRSDVWVDMREANRKGVAPAFRAADAFQLDAKVGSEYRECGFGALLSAPAGQLLSGTSVLATTREDAKRSVILQPQVFDHAAFEASGPGYPSTPLGYVAQLRQLFLDARHFQDLGSRRLAGRPGPRPPYDADLEAIRPALEGERRIVCEAEEPGDIERWIDIADEFGLRIAVSGGTGAWRVAGVLAERGIPVFLTLEWGDEVADPGAGDPPDAESGKTADEGSGSATSTPEQPAERSAPSAGRIYEEPRVVREERRRLWEEKRACAMRLAEAGVDFCFGSGKRSPKELLGRVRKLVASGIDEQAALAALTETPARLLGVGKSLGRIEAGYDATFAIWTDRPLADEARVAWMFIDGAPFELDVEPESPAEGIDATGTWSLDLSGWATEPAKAELEMASDGRVHGSLEYVGLGGGRLEGRVSGDEIELRGRVAIETLETEVEIRGKITRESMTGTHVWKWAKGPETASFTAKRRAPGREE